MTETIIGLALVAMLVGIALSIAMLPFAILTELYLNYVSRKKDRKHD